jgi:hypothetical protein
MQPPWITKRQIMVAVAALAVVVAAWRSLLWFGEREMLRHEAAYSAEMRRLHLDYEVKIRGGSTGYFEANRADRPSVSPPIRSSRCCGSAA